MEQPQIENIHTNRKTTSIHNEIVVQDANSRLAVKIANSTVSVFLKKYLEYVNRSILAKAQLHETLSSIES